MIDIGEFDDLHEMTFTDSVPLEWQELAGHSDQKLTARYSHRRLYDLAGAVDKLPNLVPSTVPVSNASEIPLRMTGTDAVSGAVPVAVTGGIGLHRTALKYTSAIVGGISGDVKDTLEMKEPALFSAGSHRVASTRATGLEPATSGSTVRCSNQLSYAPLTRLVLIHVTPPDDKARFSRSCECCRLVAVSDFHKTAAR